MYKNNNYGANLQAFALNKICNNYGLPTETILYCNNNRFYAFLSNIKQFLKSIGKQQFNKRKKRIAHFRNSIPHSKVYYKNSIRLANKRYDCFLVGSDQVWNPENVNDFYSLSFVQSNKSKISYAASIGKKVLTEKQKQFYNSFLKDFSFISVREEDAVSLLDNITEKNIELVLDPTLLLTADEWSTIIKRRMINDDYLFCYFLNESTEQRNVAAEFAKVHGLKIVTLPYLSYRYRKCDDDFGDYRLFDVGPEDFVSLILYSRFVFTDSFHATVFAHIFKKQFIAFDDMKSSTGSRLETLTRMFHTERRYINSPDNICLSYIDSIEKVDFSQDFKDFDSMKEQSVSFLKKVLGKE